MDWWGRLWGAKKWSLAAVAPFLSGERLWAIVVLGLVLGIALILAVCWLACRFKDDDIETPLINVRRAKSKQKAKKKSEEHKEKDDART
jgi:hypothetical protein